MHFIQDMPTPSSDTLKIDQSVKSKYFFRSQISFWLCYIDPNDSRRNNIWKKILIYDFAPR